MKKFYLGIVTGLVAGLLLATATFALAADQIKLIVNGKEIQCDVPPQNIDGRMLVPARFLAEALGAAVEWDATNNAVVVTSKQDQALTPAPQPGDKDSDQGQGQDKGEVKVTPINEKTPEGNTKIGETRETKDGVTWQYKIYDSNGNQVGEGGGGGAPSGVLK